MKKINLFSRLQEFDGESIACMGNDFILINPSKGKEFSYSTLDYLMQPNKLETLSVTLITRGEVSFYLDFKEYRMKAPCAVVYFPGQILQYGSRDREYDARYIHFSAAFANRMSRSFYDFPTFHHTMRARPVLPLSAEKMAEYLTAFDKAQSIVSDGANPYREELVVHWAAFLFYEILSLVKAESERLFRPEREVLVNQFMELVRENHASRRDLKFYAEKLHLTPKYLTTVIKQESGVSAADWIERHAILHAQAMLKSTDLTIQQVSDKLNFSSQVFFSKYFKRLTGMSPTEYRAFLARGERRK